MKLADNEFHLEELRRHQSAEANKKPGLLRVLKMQAQRLSRFAPALRSAKKETMETAILEKTIVKLGSLLALGFGEAGVNIVSTNMRGLDTSGVNAMIPGHRVDCIISTARVAEKSPHVPVITTAKHHK